MFYSDVFHGGVTAGGFSTGLGVGSGVVNLHIESGSTVRKSLILTFSTGKHTNQPIEINNIDYYFNSSNVISSFSITNPYFSPIYLHCIDITNILNSLPTSVFSITVPSQPELPFEGVFAPFIYIAYENPTLSVCNTNIIINNQDLIGDETYTVNNLNPISTSFPVGFSLYTDRTGSGWIKTNIIKFNGNLLGVVGGSDAVNNSWIGAGTKGHFYYQNNTLFGLDDDTPDAVMDSTDALADVSSFLNNNSTSCNFQLTHSLYPGQSITATNVNLSFFLTYTTPCDTFTTTLTPDTTICYGETLQLQATGGQSYAWTALTDSSAIDDLSCTDCPNPTFSGTKSQVYTVRIWNTDSCSVVKPVRITVKNPQPLNSYTGATVCGFENGYIKTVSFPSDFSHWYIVTPDHDTLDNPIGDTYPDLGAGEYKVFYYDSDGCKSDDTVIYVEPVINTVAQFNVLPKTGTAPIQINVTNQSQNATDYSWWLNDEYQGNSFSGFYTDTSGVYEIELIAWRNDTICADTASFTVIVFDSLAATLPNVFTPNNDGVNDNFNVKVNLSVDYDLVILNRWGNVVFENAGHLEKGTHNLWNGKLQSGKLVVDGTYFYKITFRLDNETINCEITDCEVVKEGFVKVFGG
ncbi:MAG: gliding motility-associated C-terminal domain-containing protein [Balneolaceae bacterium]